MFNFQRLTKLLPAKVLILLLPTVFVSLLTPSFVKAETNPQQSIQRQPESPQLKIKVDELVKELRSLNTALQAGMTFGDYATRVTRLNQAYFEIKDESEFRNLSGTVWLARAIDSHVDALLTWQGLFTQEIPEIYEMEIKSRQRHWEMADNNTGMFTSMRKLHTVVNLGSLNSHCQENSNSSLCK